MPGPEHTRRIEYRELRDLEAAPRNPKRHHGDLAGSVARFGYADAVIVDDRTDRLVAGHGRLAELRRLQEAGEDPPDGIETRDGQWLVPVQCGWSSRSDSEAEAFLLAHNKIGEAGGWDDEELKVMLASLDDLKGLGFTEAELAALNPEEPPEDPGAGDPTASPSPFSAEQIIEAGFAWYREHGFPYRCLTVPECMLEINRLAAGDPAKMLTIRTGYHVADTYHPHRFHGSATGMRSPIASFNNDTALRKALRLILEEGSVTPAMVARSLSIVNGAQACANFRPGFALALIREFCPNGGSVLDTSTGYGGRLTGFLASSASRYVGIDPSTKTHEGNQRLARDLGGGRRVELHNLPAEDVAAASLGEACDFAVTSPPYFCKEIYADEDTQSAARYGKAEEWRDGFLAPMLRLQFSSLRPGAHSCLNIADVSIRGSTYPLAAWAKECAIAAGFDYVELREFELGGSFGYEHPAEPVHVLRKPL